MSDAGKPLIISAAVDETTLARLDEVAQHFRVNRSIIIRWALDEYLTSFFARVRPSVRTDIKEEGTNKSARLLEQPDA